MVTLILEEPGRIVAHDTPAPGDPGPGEALVQVRRIGVCGTDLHAFCGRQPFFEYPRILGHELGVEIVAVGAGVTDVRPGDRCAVEPYLNCGRCIACTQGRPNCCRTLQVLGVHTDGGHRERILVPAAKLHLSRQLTLDQLALVETLGIGAHAVDRAQVQAGETVAVIGAGPIGLSVIQFALVAGARVVVVDVSAGRLDFCRDRLGVIAQINATTEDIPARLDTLTGGDLPTVLFDATGNQKSMNAAFTYPAQGGRLVLVGLIPGDVTFSDPNFHRRELTVLSSRNSVSADFIRIIRLIESGSIDTTPWITHRAPLLDAPARFASWTRSDSGVVKAMLDVPGI
jgi:2-desacetyl-2-hydroxyethyl bacteriochlorophyllide A dehydrogenase